MEIDGSESYPRIGEKPFQDVRYDGDGQKTIRASVRKTLRSCEGKDVNRPCDERR
jgi:hypothetical protein